MQTKFWFQRMIGLVFMMMTSPFFVCAQVSSGKNAALLVQADTMMNRQDYEGAISLFNQVLEKSKLVTDEDYKILYKRSFCYYNLGQFEEALKDVNEYLQKVPDDQAKLLRAYVNQELGNFDAQLADLNEFIASSPGNPDLLRWRASVLMEAERYPEAEKDIRSLLQVQPGPELKAYLGLIYYYQQDADSALTIFEEVMAENPEYLQTYLYSASLALEEEAFDLALQYVNTGLALDPGNLTLLFYKGIALVENQDVDEGCRCLRKAFAGGMDDASDYLKSYCYSAD